MYYVCTNACIRECVILIKYFVKFALAVVLDHLAMGKLNE